MTDKELIAEALDKSNSIQGLKGYYRAPGVSDHQAKVIGDLLGKLAAALEAHQWRPIDTAPRDGKVILGFPKIYAVVGYTDWAGEWVEDDASDWWCASLLVPQPTHWMPLPNPPEVEK
jgi:hypothetical protein